MSERTYSEREIADLIARAAERQQDARRRDSGAGLTLAEIERIGAETGIDPEHLRAAAAEMDAAGRTLGRQSGQTKTHVSVERWIDAPLTAEAWEDAVAELRGRHGVDASFWMGNSAGGTVQQVGNAYEWHHTSGLGVQTTVTASPRDGRTRLQIRQLVGHASPTAEGVGYGFLVALVAAPIAGGIAEAGGLAGAAWVAALAFLAVWAAAAPLIMTLDRRWRARKLQDLDALADDLVPLLANAVPGGVASAASGGMASAPGKLADAVGGPAPAGRTDAAETTRADAASPEAGHAPGARLDLDALGDGLPAAEAPPRRRARE